MKIKFFIIVVIILSLSWFIYEKYKSRSANPVSNECKRAGCSNQLCVEFNSPEIVTTCEYKEIYGCYQKANCRRLSTGECGFEETKELTDCLNGLNVK